MDHNDARQVLLALADNPDPRDRAEAIKVVMRERDVPTTRDITVPFPAGRTVLLRVPTDRFTAADWRYLMRVFEVMKPGIVTDDEPSAPDLGQRQAGTPTPEGN